MKIAVGCSMKFRSHAIDVVDRLEKLGLVPLFPNLKQTNKEMDVAENPGEKKRFAIEHYAAIDQADAVYLVVPGGVMGTSLKLELGYAVAKGKPIYFSETTNDFALDCYVKEFIPVDSLDKFLEIK